MIIEKTGLILFDKFTGGFPIGKSILISGKEGLGKTSLALQIIPSAITKVYYIDTENALYEDRIKMIKPDIINKIEFFDSITFERIQDELESKLKKIKEQEKILLIWDSIASTTTEAELKEGLGYSEMGFRARLLSQFFRKFGFYQKFFNLSLILINQLRYKINATPFEDPYVLPGGTSQLYHSFIHIHLKGDANFKKTEEKDRLVKIQVKKNKIKFPVDFKMVLSERGFDNEYSIFNYITENKLVASAGAWYKFQDWKFQGITGFKELFNKDNEFKTEILNAIK